MSLPPTTNSSIFNSSYFPASTLTLAAADQRYLLLTGGIIGGSLSLTGTAKAASLLVGTSTDTTRMISCLDSAMAAGNTRFISLGYDNSDSNQLELGFTRGATNSWAIGFHSHPMIYGTSVSSNYYIGINRSSPSYQLDVNGTTNASSYRVGGSEVINASKAFVGSGGVDIANRIYMRVNGYGLSIRGDTTNNDTELVSLVDGGGGHLGTYSSHSFSLMAGNTDRVRIFSTGTVSIGTNSSSNARLYLTSGNGSSTIPGSDTIQKIERSGFSQPMEPIIVSNPSLVCADNIVTYGALFVASDRRLKQDIRPCAESDALRFVRSVEPIRYRLKSGDNRVHYGYVAQQLMEHHFGELIDIQEDRNMEDEGDEYDLVGYRLSVDYSRSGVLLHRAMQHMMAEIEEQQATIDALVKKMPDTQPADRRRVSFVRDQDFSDEQVLGLKLRHWRRNTDGRSDFGLLAQECRTQLPELVSMKADPDMKKVQPDDIIGQLLSVSHDKLGVILLPVVQRLLKRVHALETEFGLTGVVYTD